MQQQWDGEQREGHFYAIFSLNTCFTLKSSILLSLCVLGFYRLKCHRIQFTPIQFNSIFTLPIQSKVQAENREQSAGGEHNKWLYVNRDEDVDASDEGQLTVVTATIVIITS